jgi:RND family efflux transporter MFP subunit
MRSGGVWGFSILLTACSASQAKEPAAAPPALPVQLATVERAKLRDTSDYVSVLKSRRSVAIQPQVTGWVVSINVISGTKVAEGAHLMEIDARQQLANVRNQQAAREAQVASVAYWRTQYARLQRLYAGGGASKQEVDQARSALDAAEANVRAVDESVRSQSVLLRYHQVTAPEAGTVGDIPVRVGDLVSPSTLLTTIDHNESLDAYVNVPVDRGIQVRDGLPVEILGGDTEPVARSFINFISPHVTSDQTVLVKSWVDNRAGRLRNAQLVRARVVWSESEGPVVPMLAVQTRNGQNFVWVARDDGHGGLVAEQRVVQVGPIQGQVIPVTKGVAPGERVIVGALQKLRSGMPVMPAKDRRS